jgi:4'-phosphopantetheinyl transferase
VIECAVWWTAPLADAPDLLDLLTPAELERHGRYRQEADRRRFLTGRVLAKTLAGRRLGLPAREVEFDATCTDCGRQHGPPRIPGAPLTLSISHSGNRVGVAVTGGEPVGLDVEGTGRHVDDGLIGYALNDAESSALDALPAEEKAEAFFTYWCRKEAVMKATGRGLRIPLRALTLSAPGQPAHLSASDEAALDPATTRLADLDPGPGYRAAVAVLTTGELAVTEHDWEGLNPPLG